MAKLIKCPRCQSQVDVTNLAGGSTVRCPDCGAMARIPTGNTAIRPAAPAVLPEPDPASGGGSRPTKVRNRQTNLFKKMSGVKGPGEKNVTRVRREGSERGGSGAPPKSNAPMVIGICAGAVVLIGAVAFFAMHKGEKDEKVPAKSTAKKSPASSKAGSATHPTSPPPPPPTGPAAAFETGARAKAGVGKEIPSMPITDEMRGNYEALASSGKVAEIVAADYQWIYCAIDGILSDSEPIARNSLLALNEISKKRKITAGETSMSSFFSVQVRVDAYGFWAGPNFHLNLIQRNAIKEWATAAGGQVGSVTATPNNPSPIPAPAPSPVPGATPASAGGSAEWDRIMQDLRSGSFDDPAQTAYNAFRLVEAKGKPGWAKLIEYIDNEDPGIGGAAVQALIRLTKRDSPAPKENTKAKIKEDWKGWYNASP